MAKAANKEKGSQDMFSLALQNFALPGDADFPLNAFFEKPKWVNIIHAIYICVRTLLPTFAVGNVWIGIRQARHGYDGW